MLTVSESRNVGLTTRVTGCEEKTMTEESGKASTPVHPLVRHCSVCNAQDEDVFSMESCDWCGRIVCDNCCDWTHDEDDYDNGGTACSACQGCKPIRGHL